MHFHVELHITTIGGTVFTVRPLTGIGFLIRVYSVVLFENTSSLKPLPTLRPIARVVELVAMAEHMSLHIT